MDEHKKLEFIHKMAKLGLQHFDAGGAVSTGGNGPEGLAGNITGALGLNDKFQGQAANIQSGTTANQVTTAYNQAQSGLNQQQNLTNALTTQAQQAAGAQAGLSSQLQGLASGQGPNVAQNQLNQATGQNVAQQAALMAGQRGSSANVGLLARQNAQQGAATQQNAAGQAATLGAQQQIAAQQNLASLSNNQVGQTQGAVQGLNNSVQNEQNVLQGANTAYNNAEVGMQSNVNNVNSQTASQNANIIPGMVSGVGGGITALAGLLAKGGTVQKMAAGGQISGNPLVTSAPANGPQSFVGQWLNSSPDMSSASIGATSSLTSPFSKSSSSPSQSKSKADPTEGATDITGQVGDGMLAAKGGNVKAQSKNQKAVSSSDSYENDKIPAMLSEGEVVIDKDTLADKGPIGQMARAIKAHLAARNSKK